MKYSDMSAKTLANLMELLNHQINNAHAQLLFGDGKDDVWAAQVIEDGRNNLSILAYRYVQVELQRISDEAARDENS